ncbi:peptidase [Sphingomonas sanxanigenens DSM 19645 = NX02]|nr:peptidase [Sphingomonas sanxanigenens DSM 19645 = NX02]
MPLPGDRTVSALTKPNVLERWSEDGAGVRSLAIDDNVITMFDIIGEDFWSGGGITAKKIGAQLRAIGAKPIEVHLNSPGGDMFEGIAIYNVLREHPQPITVKIMGMAASAASIIAMAGDTIEIGAASFMMIHNCWVMAVGNRHDMAETAEWLAPFDQAMVDVYTARTGAEGKQVARWMDAETYMSGTVAIERGFADALLPSDQIKVDENAKAADREINEIRAMELTLVAGGMPRSDARARIKNLKGTPGAATEPDGTPGAADTDLMGALARLAASTRS